MNTTYHQAIEHPRLLFFLSFSAYTIGIGCGIMSNMLLSIELAILFPLVLILLGGWKRWYIIVLMLSVSLSGWYM